MKQHCIKLASLILVIVTLFSLSIPAFAATNVAKDMPYGYNWLDETSPDNVWYFQYYSKAGGKIYSVVDYTYLIGNTLYDKDGKVISKSVRAMAKNPELDTKPTVGFSNDGSLYFLTTGGELCKMTASTKNPAASVSEKYSKYKSTVKTKYFTLDDDALAIKIGSKELTSLSFSGSYSRNDSSSSDDSGNGSSTTKKGNYVVTHAATGDPLKVCYDAYKDDKLIITVGCKNANVWVETEQLLLSETCVGAKFVGFSTNYHTILYDQDGTVYAFAYGNYKRALPISLGEEIKSYKKDSNGFIKSIKTTGGTYVLDTLLSEYDDDDYVWMFGDINKVKNSTSKSVAYSADKEVLIKLTKKSNNYLYFNGEKLSKSKKPIYFGITKTGCAIWVNSSGKLYYFNPADNSVNYVRANITRLRYDNNGFAYQYVIGSKAASIKF